MKNIQNKIFVLFFICFAIPNLGFSQDSLNYKIEYEVHSIYPPFSITKEKLNEANVLIDLNKYYSSSYVRKYISVEIKTINNGKLRTTVSENDTLSQNQKNNMDKADLGTDIAVKVRYMPENNFSHNDVKEIKFTFKVNPESEAQYPGGQKELEQFLKENAIDKIPDGIFKQYQLAAVKFIIDEQGQIINAHVSETSKDEKVDKILLETIRNMQNWKPSEYYTGQKVKQEFVFLVGDMESCNINLFTIRKD